jgi:hypothetical protein
MVRRGVRFVAELATLLAFFFAVCAVSNGRPDLAGWLVVVAVFVGVVLVRTA